MSANTEHLADAPPASDHLTDYDRRHLKCYARLLDAEADQADWRDVALIVLGLDPAATLSEPSASITSAPAG